MAHQTNVHVIHRSFNLTGSPQGGSDEFPEKVTDPVCGQELERRGSRHVLFRNDHTFYFCSTGCKDKFMDPTFKKNAA